MKKNNTVPLNNHCGYPEYPVREKVWTDEETKREQIRGAFVMGIMAIILIFPLPDFKYFSYILFIFWGIYLFLITISTSDDIMLDERLLNIRILQYLPENREKSKSNIIKIEENRLLKCKKDAHNMFILGIFFSMLYIGLLIWDISTTPRLSIGDFINYTENLSHYVLN